MKEIERGKIIWDSVVTVEISLRELQLIRDAMVATDIKDIKKIWDKGNPPDQQSDKDIVGRTATEIINSYK